MQSVRRRITEILKENGSATVAELAGALRMAPVSVRHHLDILVGEDLVTLSGYRRQNGAGRPSQIFSLTPTASRLFPQRHDALVKHMLVELKDMLPSTEMRRILQQIGERTAGEAPQGLPDQTLEERLDQVADFLTQQGYSARWEKCEGHYELHTCNCPYAGVSDEHPELCSMDQAMMQHLLPGSIRLQSRALDGALRCTYLLDNEAAAGEG